MKIHPSLKNMLTFNFVLMAALPILIVGFITLKILTQNLTEGITRKNFLLAKSLAGEVERFLSEPFSLLGQVEEIVEQKKLIGGEQINDYLSAVIRHYGFFNMIQVLDIKGVVRHVAPFSQDYVGINMSGQSAYQSAVGLRKPYWSPTFISPQTGEPTLALTRPFKQGMLVGYLNLAVLNSIADRVKIGFRGYASIADQHGTIIAHPNRSFVAERLNVKNINVVRQGLAGNEGTFRYRFRGVEKLGSVAIVPQTGWLVVVFQPVAEAFAPVKKIKNIFMAGAAVAIMLALALALTSLKKTLKPLSQLIASARKIAQGDYVFHPPPESYPEIDELARNFKIMTEAVETREEALRQSEERLAQINKCFLKFGTDPLENINQLTMLCGELMGASCALYNRLDRMMLCSWGQWNSPPDYNPVDSPDGHICYDVIKSAGDEVLVVTNLPETHYAQTDPNVLPYELQTYVGRAVKLRDACVGSLCVVYQDNVVPGEADKRVMEIIASAIGVEEERKRAEEVLRESEERYRTVLETSTDPIVVYDKEGRVTYFNPAFTKVFGWTLEERLGKKMDLFVPEDAWPETLKMIDKVLAGESFSGFETRRYTKKGDTIHVNMSAAVYKDKDGNPEGSVINLRDISEEKQLQTQLRHAQKMEAIGILAGGVAHDLNNILSGLVSYPDLLLLDIPEDSHLRKPILVIQESGQKAATIVQDLLTLARRGVAITEVLDLNGIISDFFKTPEYYKLREFHPNVQFHRKLETDLLNIAGSPVHLSKSIMNLISNAAEAMPDGGKVVIATSNQYVDKPIRGYDEVREGDYVVLSVADSGVGISPEDLERIFEPFYTKKVMGRSGTGLGMAVVWGTIKDHNGYIDVQSSAGQGTRFDLYFPITRKELTAKKSPVPKDEYRGDEKILVIDDVEKQREIARQMLTRLGYSVTTVSSGEEAIEYMKTNSADLLVLDMIMDPGIGGLETYKKILDYHPGQKAIITSGFSETDRVKETQRLGAGAYLKKPYVFEKLGLTVRNELNK